MVDINLFRMFFVFSLFILILFLKFSLLFMRIFSFNQISKMQLIMKIFSN